MSITIDNKPDQLEQRLPDGVEIKGPISKEWAEIFTPQALQFVALLSREFEGRRQALLARRVDVQDAIVAERCRTSRWRPRAFGRATGPSPRYRTTCKTAGWRSRGR